MADHVVHDSDILDGEKIDAAHVEEGSPTRQPLHLTQLTEHELALEKKLRLKIDSLIMPLVILVYLMNYIDRNNYAAAKLQGLVESLHLTNTQYQTGLSILFVAYVLMQVPSNLMLNYCGKPSWYIGFFVIAWGLVSALTSQVKSYGGIVACRFILGLVEAPFFAGILFYLSKWYTKTELSLRMAIFYSGSLLSGAFGNLIAAGILSGLDGARGMKAWQWLYIIEGTITMFIGIIICIIMPDFPDTWSRLSPEMKHVANRRLALDAAEADVDLAGGMSQWTGCKLAFKDPKTYILAVAYHMITGASGFQNFFPTLTATLGYNHIDSLLLVAPPYIFMVIWSYANSWTSDKIGHRFWFFMYPIPLTIIGFIVFMTTSEFGPRYFSFFLMIFVFAQNGIIYAWIANAIPRPPAKRAAALAFVNSVGNMASIWTPFTYIDPPDYRPALGACIGMQAVAAICAVVLRIHLDRQNKHLEALQNEDIPLREKDLAKLRKTAEMEGIDIAVARRQAKDYRYMI